MIYDCVTICIGGTLQVFYSYWSISGVVHCCQSKLLLHLERHQFTRPRLSLQRTMKILPAEGATISRRLSRAKTSTMTPIRATDVDEEYSVLPSACCLVFDMMLSYSVVLVWLAHCRWESCTVWCCDDASRKHSEKRPVVDELEALEFVVFSCYTELSATCGRFIFWR